MCRAPTADWSASRPAAGVVDVRVYDTTEEDAGRRAADLLRARGRAALGGRPRGSPPGIRIANVSLSVAPSDELEAAVAAARAAGVMVVAETGNRGTAGPMEAHPSAVPGEDVARRCSRPGTTA